MLWKWLRKKVSRNWAEAYEALEKHANKLAAANDALSGALCKSLTDVQEFRNTLAALVLQEGGRLVITRDVLASFPAEARLTVDFSESQDLVLGLSTQPQEGNS